MLGQFQPHGHKFDKLGGVLIRDATNQISKLTILRFQTWKIFMFSYISLCKICDPVVGAFIWP